MLVSDVVQSCTGPYTSSGNVIDSLFVDYLTSLGHSSVSRYRHNNRMLQSSFSKAAGLILHIGVYVISHTLSSAFDLHIVRSCACNRCTMDYTGALCPLSRGAMSM